jgi:hypothetical protein
MRGPSKLISRREPEPDLKAMAKKVAAAGTGNDTMLAHITPREAAKLKSMGGSGLVNRRTGLLSFDDGNGGGPGDSGGGSSGGTGGNGGAADGAGGGAGTGGVGGEAGAGSTGDSTGGAVGAEAGSVGTDSSATGSTSGLGSAPSSSIGDALGNAPSDLGPTVDQANALEGALDAGIFGGIGSPNPEAAPNAQAGLAAVGLGYAADPTSSFGRGFANAVASVMGQTPLGGLMSNNPHAGFGLASLATPAPISSAISAIGTAIGASQGSIGSSPATGFSGPSPANDSNAADGSGMNGVPSPSAIAPPTSTTPSVMGKRLQTYIKADGSLGFRYA